MENLSRLKLIKEKIEDLRHEMILISFDVDEQNYEDIEDFISTEAESAFCSLLDEFEEFIEEHE
jgi:hypothetical protein